MSRLEDLLDFALHGEPPPSAAVLIGPRGNGKTALLAEFAERCRTAGADVVRRTPDKLRSEEDLAVWLLESDPKRRKSRRQASSRTEEAEEDWPAEVAPLTNFAKKAQEQARKKGDKMWKLGIPAMLSARFKGMNETLRAETVRHLDLLLEYAARSRPRAAIIDEAHTLEPEIARSLLNTAQNVDSEGAPFLLVLAGTPQLPARLRQADASFWSRCEKIGVGRISDEATREALAKPLAGYGLAFTPEALDEVVEESQRYPYFIQLWGKALCEALSENATGIDLSTVEAAHPLFQRAKNNYYEDRYEELKARDLLPDARAAAEAFEKRGWKPTLDETFEAEMSQRTGAAQAETAKATAELERLGFIWKPPGGKTQHEPGIPSLMKHILERRTEPAPSVETAPTP